MKSTIDNQCKSNWSSLFLTSYCCAMLLAIGAPICHGNDIPVDDTREAMRFSTDQSWYDHKTDSLVFPDSWVLSEPAEKVANRHERTVPKKTTPQTNPWEGWHLFDDLGTLWGSFVEVPWVQEILIFAFCLFIGILVFLILRRLNPDGFKRVRKANSSKADHTKRDLSRIVDLPFPIQNLKTDLWSEAVRLRNEGDYAKAMVYLYGHILVELDAAGFVRLKRSKTNRTYVRELSSMPSLQQPHQNLVNCFEAVFFGRHPLSITQFDTCFSQVAAMKQFLSSTATGTKAKQHYAKEMEAAAEKPNTIVPTSLTTTSVLLLLFLIGCINGCVWNRADSDEFYGEASALGATRSVAGMSAFRSLCEKSGLTSIDLNGLSLRSRQLDVIVFVPKTLRTPTLAEIEWFESWLGENPRRVLVVVGRDFSPSVRYWQTAMKSESAIDRVVYAHEKSLAEMTHESMLGGDLTNEDCLWFRCVRDAEPTNGDEVTGSWVTNGKEGMLDIPMRGYFEPKGLDKKIRRKKKKPESDGYRFDSLVETKQGRPIVFSLESNRWDAGKIFVFANGALLLNEGLTIPSHRAFAKKLIETFPANSRVGFLSPQNETPIKLDSDPPEASGFELFRVWPLSLIAMQGLFLGFIVLLALFPIFGRPRKTASVSTADFGLHVEALGQLLHQTQDKNYALQKIASYFRDVKREPSSMWAQVAQPSKEFPNDRTVK